MAIVSLCNGVPPAHFSKLGFYQNPICLPDSSSIKFKFNHASLRHLDSFFRFKNARGFMIRKRLPLLHASNQPSGEPKGNPEAITNGDTSTAQGPPFLTILAGIVVFGLLLWVVGSIVSWLIGLLGLVFSK